MKKILILTSILIFILLLLFFFYKSIVKKEGFNPVSKSVIQNDRNAELTLREYLFERGKGRYEKCLEFLTKNFQNNFKRKFNTDYLNYYRNQNEDYYKDFKITSVRQQDNGLILINVTINIEGPGYKSKALENYYMIYELSSWKIYDWRIEYLKKDKEKISGRRTK